MSRQTRLGRRSIYELFKERHGSWFEKVIKSEEAYVGKGNVKAFSTLTATVQQREALETYAKQQGLKDLRGFATWLKWSEKTYYDILKIVSP